MNIRTVDLKQVAKNVTIQITLSNVRQWRWRIAIGTWLMQLAAWIMWMNIEFEGAGDDPTG